MTVSGETSAHHRPAGVPVPPAVSRTTMFWYAVAAALLAGWFLFGWLVLRQGFVDSVGEALGTASALLLTISVVEAARRHRRRGNAPGR